MALPVLHTESLHAPLQPELHTELGRILPEFLVSRRWFRAKARTVRQVSIRDVIPFVELDSSLFILNVCYAEGADDTYLLPLSASREAAPATLPGGSEPLAVLETPSGEMGVLHSAFATSHFRTHVLQSIASNTVVEGTHGSFIAAKSDLPPSFEVDFNQTFDSFVSRAEQSNTSIIYGDQFILKLFRKVESGVNPDIEIGQFLTEHGFGNTPAVLGTLSYRSQDGTAYAAGILQKFVRNEGDAWKYTLDELGGFFQRSAKARGMPAVPRQHPLDLMKETAPAEVQTCIGPYLQAAALLGRRTAEMHRALASEPNDPEFRPERFTEQDAQALHSEMLAQANISFRVLRTKAEGLRGAAADHAATLLNAEEEIRDRFAQVQTANITAQRIRFHGDYHLGQVLYTGSDFMIIDFEGEPARPLSERREKTLCLRDVAGMVRSFQYAGYASLFGQVPGLPEGDTAQIETQASLWNAWCSASYLQGYFKSAGQAAFLPDSEGERRLVLDAFLLHKALYEVAYELNNRPDWVIIPLRGILGLLQ